MKAVRFCRSVEVPTGTYGISDMKLCWVEPGGWARMYWGASRATCGVTSWPLAPTIGCRMGLLDDSWPLPGSGDTDQAWAWE